MRDALLSVSRFGHRCFRTRWRRRWLGLPLLLLLAACGDDEGDAQGTPVSPPAPARADAAADVADAARDGDGPGDAMAEAAAEVMSSETGPAAPLGSTGGGVSCDTCERRSCGEYPAKCLGAVGKAGAGARKDVARAELCVDLLTCVRGSACAATSARDCYCGAGVSDQDCASGKATGACKAQIEGGAESSDPKEVMARLFDPNFATGNALTLIEACDRPSCLDVCQLKSRLGSGGMRACPTPVTGPGQCPDLDGNCVSDCTETLVQNAGFVDTNGWTAEPNGKLGWDTKDATGMANSGGLAVTNTLMANADVGTLVGARQCLGNVMAGARHDLFASAFIAEGQSAGSAAIVGAYFASSDCSGTPLKNNAAPMLEGKTGTWLTLTGGGEAPSGSGSLSVRLVVAKQAKLPALRVIFDNVLVSKRAP
jgi:hypothetical protein